MNSVTKLKIRFLSFKKKKEKQSSMFKRHKLLVFSFCAKNNQFSQTITPSFIRKSLFFRQIVNVMCLRSFAKQKTFRGCIAFVVVVLRFFRLRSAATCATAQPLVFFINFFCQIDVGWGRKQGYAGILHDLQDLTSFKC